MKQFFSLQDVAGLKKFNLISASEAADKNGLTPAYIRWLLRNNKISGAFKIGITWVVPKDWKYKPFRKGGKHGPRNEPVLALENPDKKENK